MTEAAGCKRAGSTRSHVNQQPLRFFDSIAEEYHARYATDSLGGYVLRERRSRVLELLAGAEGSVLDVGCGPGVMVEDLLNLGCTVWGVDGSPRMIEACEKRFGGTPGARFCVADATGLPFRDGSFDGVICMGVIDHVVPPAAGITEMARVLRPGGTLLVSFPNLLSPYAFWRGRLFYPVVGLLKRLRSRVDRCPGPDFATRRNLWTPRSASRAVEQLVGEVRDVAHYNFEVLLSPLDELLPDLALRLARRLELLRATRLRWLGAGFILKATKHSSSIGQPS
jgi:SAM-dependent methyltransferase